MGKLQNEDFKTEAELTGAGGAKSQLLNDTKIYITADGINKTLDDAIADGDIGGGTATVVESAVIRDIKASGTEGGSFNSGAWRTRDLNSSEDPSGIIVSLSSNQFTLGAGDYFITASASAGQVNAHKCRLYNTSDAIEYLGNNGHGGSSTTLVYPSIVSASFSIASNKVFELQHYCETSQAGVGFGRRLNVGGISEVYSTVQIIKIS